MFNLAVQIQPNNASVKNPGTLPLGWEAVIGNPSGTEAEAAQEKSEIVPPLIDRIYKAVMDDFEDGIYIMDPQRRITHWNSAAERITGYKAEEIVGRYYPDNPLNHFDMKGNLLRVVGRPLFKTLSAGNRPNAEVLLRHKEGHRVCVRVKSIPVVQDREVVAAIELFTQIGGIPDGLLDVLSD